MYPVTKVSNEGFMTKRCNSFSKIEKLVLYAKQGKGNCRGISQLPGTLLRVDYDVRDVSVRLTFDLLN